MAQKAPKPKDTIESIEDSLSRTEMFIETNQKLLLSVLAGIIIVVGAVLAYQQFIVKPKEAEANTAMFRAELYFQKDSFNLALNGNDAFQGFLSVADDFGGTDAGNLAHYYAGICYLQTGKFEEAINELGEYSGSDVMTSCMALGAQGDALMELGKTQEAVDMYIKAAGKHENMFSTPMYLMKAGNAYEDLGNNEKALEIYKKIRSEYFQSPEGRDAEKYIARAEAKASK
ncbi:MAG: tetratricopeptide repeat protein [Bacteroidia bacterium]